ncbi:hypothetical protein PuT2_15460 [Pusillimonas sp. T2]|uniref:DUF1643 domain-containing protein n=1 Tax=Pusillimonas sp. T2 TaxID=1548123 RepID=UPI000B8EA480|nr:DUF1643 domain-containing protein [Pusillimonas sp. T2]OXR47888.1 hypothetical protein PuT2_15460 [Pusillimonas sp. T2]
MIKSAIISDCEQYRYRLTRQEQSLIGNKPPIAFLMLNPSTADATEDDPTIRRLIGFARTWGHSGVVVANLYALRSPNPTALWSHTDPVGPDNDRHLLKLAKSHSDIVCAWGNNARADRVGHVVQLLKNQGATLWCLGQTNSGAPRHPLYVKSDQELLEWELKS